MLQFKKLLTYDVAIAKHLICIPKILQGKLKYRETVTEGFDKMFDAFLGLFTGENIGKAVVKA